MRRTSVALGVMLLFAALPTGAQTVYGLFGLPPNPDPGIRQVGTLDPTDGSVVLIGGNTSIDTDTVTIGAGITAISVAGNVLYFVGQDNGDATSKVFTVDLATGSTTNSAALSSFSSGTTLGLWFDETSGTLWGLFANGGDRALAAIDPTTGVVATPINSAIAGENFSTAGGVFSGDADGLRVFIIGTPDSGEAQLWEVSTDTGDVTPYPFEDWDEGTVQGIEWDPTESMLWMIVHRGSGRQLAWYDFDEQAVILADGEIDFGDPVATTQGLIALDDATAQLFFIGRPDGGNWSIYTVEVPGGDATSVDIEGGSIQINGWAGFEIIPGPELAFSKDDGDVSAVPGDTVTWTLTASNAAGAGPAIGVEITETVPEETSFSDVDSTTGWVCVPDVSSGSTCTFSLPDIDPGSNEAADFAVVIDASVRPDLTELSNTAIVSATNTTTDVEASDTTPVTAAAHLTLVKSDGDSTTTPGSTVVYGISAGNTGDADALQTVLSDTVPANTKFSAAGSTAGWSCVDGAVAGTLCNYNIGTFEGGDSAMVNFAVTVVASVPAGTVSITNQAALSSTTTTSAVASDTTPVTASPTLELEKSDGDAGSEPGEVVVYVLAYSNSGNEDAANALLTETVPDQTTLNATASTAGWVCVPDTAAGSTCTLSLGTLPGGGSGTADFAVRIDEPVLAGTAEISNQSELSADNAAATATAADTTPVTAAPDLTLTKSDGGVTTMPGNTLSYVLVYENEGNENAADVVLTETVPGNTTFLATSSTPGWVCTPDGSVGSTCVFDIGGLTGGDASLVFFAVTVDDPVAAGTIEISNTASIEGSNTAAPTIANDTTPVTAEPALTLTKDDGDTTSEPGGVVVYTLIVGNDGNEGSLDTQLTETVPAYSIFEPASSTAGWSCLPDGSAGSICTLDIDPVAGGGGMAAVSFAVRVGDPFPVDIDQLSNQASVSATNAAESAQASDLTPIDKRLDLAVTKSDGGSPTRPGGTISYLIGWENVGNQSTAGVAITETVPADTSFFAGGSEGGWVCTPDAAAGSTCTLTIGELQSGASGSAAFAVIVDDPITGGVVTIDNTVAIADDGNLGVDVDPSNNTGSTVTPIDASPPTVVAVDTVPGIGGIENCAQLDRTVSQLTVELEDVFSGVVDPDQPASYLVVAAGPDGDLATDACGPVFGDDVEIPINQVTITGESTNPIATLELSASLGDGIVLVLICDTLVDEAGNALDGDLDGQPGGDSYHRFRVDIGNEFANAHLDDCDDVPIALAPWQPDPVSPAFVGPTLGFDIDDSGLSGSIELQGIGGTPISVGQCLPVNGGMKRWLEAFVRIDTTVTTAFDVHLWCSFSEKPSCFGLGPQEILASHTLEPSMSPDWEEISAFVVSEENANSAYCGVDATGVSGDAIAFYMDSAYTTETIFSDGFESGDTSAWSATNP